MMQTNEKPTNTNMDADPKPTLAEFIDGQLPFRLPRLALPQTMKNLDKAVSRMVLAGGEALASSVERRTRVKDAKANAHIDLIKRGSRAAAKRIGINDPKLVRRAIEAAIGEIVQEQCNRERIAKIAAEELEASRPSADAKGEIDDDWLSLFALLAGKKSGMDIQSLWGKLLAGEIRQPGLFKLRTLQRLSVLDAVEAQLIHRCLRFVLDGRWVFHGANHLLLSLEHILELEDLGVVQGTSGTLSVNVRLRAGSPTHLKLGNLRGLRLLSAADATTAIHNVCHLTPFGKELYKLADHQTTDEGVIDQLLEYLGGEGRVVEVLELGPNRPDGTQAILSAKRLPP